MEILELRKMLGRAGASGKLDFAILLGAGASVTAGFPLVSTVAALLSRWRRELEEDPTAAVDAALESYLDDENINADGDLEWGRRSYGFSGPSSELYEKLFADRLLFPHPASRTAFFRQLVTSARRRTGGFNLECLFLAHLADRDPRFRVFLTTNFDDVLPTCFDLLQVQHRVLDDPDLILQNLASSDLARIVYLHGRHVGPALVNSSGEIARTRGAKSKNGRAIKALLKAIAPGSVLVVSGYAGWESGIMDCVRGLVTEGAFKGGVIWCTFPADGVSPLVEKLATHENFHLFRGVKTIDVARELLRCARSDEAAVIEHVRHHQQRLLRMLNRRAISTQEAALALCPDESQASGKELQRREETIAPPPLSLVIRECEAARKDPEHSSIALEMIRHVLQKEPGLKRAEKAQLYRLRADLRAEYALNLEAALTDQYSSLRLQSKPGADQLLDLAELLVDLRLKERAAAALERAQRTRIDRGSVADVRAKIVAGRLAYFGDEMEDGIVLFREAHRLAIRRRQPRLASRAALFASLLEDFRARRSASREWMRKCRPAPGRDGITYHLARARLLLRDGEVAKAERALKKAETLARRHRNLLNLAQMFHERATIAFRRGDIAGAHQYDSEAAAYFGLSGHTHEASFCSFRIALNRYAGSGGNDREAFRGARRGLDVLRQVDDDVMVASYSALLATCGLLSPLAAELRGDISQLIDLSREHLALVKNRLGMDNDIYRLVAQYSALADLAWYTQPGTYGERKAAAVVNDNLIGLVSALGFEASQVQALYWMVALRAAAKVERFRWIPGARLRPSELRTRLAGIAELGLARLLPPRRRGRSKRG